MTERTETGETSPRAERAETVNLSQTSLEKVEADLVRMSQSGAGQIQAGEVEIRQGGAGQIRADQVSANQALIGMVEAGTVNLSHSPLAMAKCWEIHVKESPIVASFSENARLEDVQANLIVARRIEGGPVRSIVLLAGKVDGPVETVLDTPRAMLAGLMAGVGAGMVIFVAKLLTRRKR